ncbi:hypothetical protein [Caballeronia humi]|uniref:hypothetical protein n=1 Tax=Caballeronia humi TaxID=326474 RepID=UPI000B3EBFFD
MKCFRDVLGERRAARSFPVALPDEIRVAAANESHLEHDRIRLKIPQQRKPRVARAKVVDGGLAAEALSAKEVDEMRPGDDLLVVERLENDPSIGKPCSSAASSVLRMQN